MSDSDYYVVWLQVKNDLLVRDDRKRKRATDSREREKARFFAQLETGKKAKCNSILPYLN